MPPKKKPGKVDTEEALTRIAIISAERCRPKKCHQECKKSCPVVKLGKLCIEVTPKAKLAFISEPLCIGKCVRNGFNSSSSLLLITCYSRLWYLRQEVPLRGDQHHQSSKELGEKHDPPVRTELVQAPSSTHASTRSGSRVGKFLQVRGQCSRWRFSPMSPSLDRSALMVSASRQLSRYWQER